MAALPALTLTSLCPFTLEISSLLPFQGVSQGRCLDSDELSKPLHKLFFKKASFIELSPNYLLSSLTAVTYLWQL